MQIRTSVKRFISIMCICLVMISWGTNIGAKELKLYKGSYIQMGFLNESPILWRVLDVTGEKVLLISDQIIVAGSYGTSSHASINVEWEKSLIRKWLNSVEVGESEGFYNTTFQEKEKNLMVPIEIGQVADELFVLSYYDVLKYFPSGTDRVATSTEAAKMTKGYSGKSVYVSEGKANWWTRTPHIGDSMMCIGQSGKMTSSKSLFVNSVGVRPSVVIDSSKIYSIQGEGTKANPFKLGQTEASSGQAGAVLPQWQKDKTYNSGDQVQHKNKKYSCLQGHTALENWSPEAAPALWIEMKQEGTWVAGKAYAIGDVVEINGTNYKCIQAHTALDGWQPEKAPALWSK